MNKIKSIFYEYQQTEEYTKDDNELSSVECDKAFEMFVGDNMELDEILNGAMAEQELNGFIHGFKYVMHLMVECGIKGVN